MLIVVRAEEGGLYEHLARTFDGVRGVKVIVERRRGDRRRARRDVAVERRGGERRLRSGRRFALGYTAVRFGSVAPAPPPRPADLQEATREPPG